MPKIQQLVDASLWCGSRARFLFAILCLGSTLVLSAAPRPNVVFVITDDQGYGDLACHGNPVLKTPELDRLHAESIRLTDYHVSPTCSPTRAALVSGHWTNRTGAWHTIMGRSILRANETIFAESFREAGYATGMFGKWHLGDNYPYRPEDRGFTEVLRHGGGGVGQTPDYWDNAYFGGTYFRNGKPEAATGFCTDVWFDAAKDFIRKQNEAGKPFLAYLSMNAPHGPMHAPEQYSRPYRELGEHVANFFGMIANIDENVGKLRSFLDAENLTGNTIFIFTTDNGTSSGGKVFNAGMRGTKGSAYDGGHRVPFFIYWPEGKLTGGLDVSELTGHVDVFPTLLDLCDLTPPPGVRFDGQSLLPLLQAAANHRPIEWPDRVWITDSQRVKDPIKWRQSASMTKRWRPINGKTLYDINQDPGQEQDLADRFPDVTKRLQSAYEAWWTELKPTFAEGCPLYLGDPSGNPATLTCHDWITTSGAPWNQALIRQAMDGPGNTGYWLVNVTRPGRYQVSLRRWPPEVPMAISQSLPAGAPVPGDRAFRDRPGVAFPAAKARLRIGDRQWEQAVRQTDQAITFEMNLEPGVTELEGRFEAPSGDSIGAYYAVVTRL